MRVVVLTSNAYLRCLPTFAYLFNKHWSAAQPVMVVRYDGRPPQLPANFEQFAVGNQSDFTWSSGLRRFLLSITDDVLLLLLEDYFLDRPVDRAKIAAMIAMMAAQPAIAKVDLSGDRARFENVEYPSYQSVALVRSTPDAPFQTSLQAALWRRGFLLECLHDSETPWQFEKKGTRRLIERGGALVLGLKHPALHYVNAIGGEGNMPDTWSLLRFPQPMIVELQARGLL